jgi:long-chain acyl-CoA synthetase
MDEVIEVGASAGSVSLIEPTPESIYMFCYTSGTTGDPKAAMLSHSNLMAAAAAAALTGIVVDSTSTIISYLPLAHSFEKFLFVTTVIGGGRIGYYSGDPLKILDDL